jgi:hypothetical protein
MAEPGNTYLGAVLIEAAIKRGDSRQEVIDLCVRCGRLDVARAIQTGQVVPGAPSEPDPSTEQKLQFNPEPLRVTNAPRCRRCHRYAPGCTCGTLGPDYEEAPQAAPVAEEGRDV